MGLASHTLCQCAQEQDRAVRRRNTKNVWRCTGLTPAALMEPAKMASSVVWGSHLAQSPRCGHAQKTSSPAGSCPGQRRTCRRLACCCLCAWPRTQRSCCRSSGQSPTHTCLQAITYLCNSFNDNNQNAILASSSNIPSN